MQALSPKHLAVHVKPFRHDGSSAKQAFACNEQLSTRQFWSTRDESKPFPPYLAASSSSPKAGETSDKEITAVATTVDKNFVVWLSTLSLDSDRCNGPRVCLADWKEGANPSVVDGFTITIAIKTADEKMGFADLTMVKMRITFVSLGTMELKRWDTEVTIVLKLFAERRAVV
jgi:hypothetical protein